MAAQPNIRVPTRAVLALVGLAMMAWGFFGTDSETVRYVLALLGGYVLVEAIIGYSLIVAARGPRRET
jgi:hypothetical protein